MFEGHGVERHHSILPWEHAEMTEDELALAYGFHRHQCPGDGINGCGVWIPLDRYRCFFCTKTIRLRQEG